MNKYVMALDQGTTSSRAIIFDKAGTLVSVAQKEFTQIFPQPGWVEHDPTEIWSSQIGVATEAMAKAGLEGGNITAIGITNQRETTIVWDRETGKPVYNAIVWQDRRTASFCDSLKAAGKESLVREKTGLVIDAYDDSHGIIIERLSRWAPKIVGIRRITPTHPPPPPPASAPSSAGRR